MKDVLALVQELCLLETQLDSDGWVDPVNREAWQVAHAELNRFYSPLEIRQMMWEVSHGKF